MPLALPGFLRSHTLFDNIAHHIHHAPVGKLKFITSLTAGFVRQAAVVNVVYGGAPAQRQRVLANHATHRPLCTALRTRRFSLIIARLPLRVPTAFAMTTKSLPKPTSHTVVNWLLRLYLLFVVYGSLVPLKYVERSLEDALLAFQHIPYLTLGVASRADWIANGVLYLPVGFFLALAFQQTFQKLPTALTFVVAGVASMLLAVAVEFTQLYFPQRTVSLNDILAECVGALLGLVLADRYAGWFRSFIDSFFGRPQRLKTIGLDAYMVAYLAFALFPYDFLLSWAELQGKIDSHGWGWLIASDSPKLTLLGLQLLAEFGLSLPFGSMVTLRAGSSSRGYKEAVVLGLLLGTTIETFQFFMASGISQGLSVLTRLLGVCCGVALSRNSAHWTADLISAVLRRYTLPLAFVYLLVLLEINGWLTMSWHGFEPAARKLDQISFIPFYYHYFTTEAKALFSLATVSFSYAPIGLLVWAHRRSPRFALGVALILASVIEVGKLFLQKSHPDPTNVLLACAASWFAVVLLRQLCRKDHLPAGLSTPVGVEATALNRGASQTRKHVSSMRLWVAFCLALTGVWAATFPAFPSLVCLVLILSAAAVWYRPAWVFAVIPAALPIFDLAPWSGRFFLDEFDALLLVTLTIAAARVPVPPKSPARVDALFATVATLLALSFIVSAVRGMLPFQLPGANSFNNYYSPYNALRIVKGAAWAYLIYGLAKRFVARATDIRRHFAWGMVVGLGLTVLAIIWERAAFSVLWEFKDTYRVTGPFSAIHVGGAYIECFLAAATPFLMVLLLEKRHWLAKGAGVLLLLATTYALMVTFSRSGYLAFALAVTIVLLTAALHSKHWARNGFVLAALAGAMLVIAVPIFKGEFSQARMATVDTDLGVRQAHWEDALNMRDSGWGTSLFGMGLGRYPESNFWRSAEGNRSATYRLESTENNTYLRLSAGNSVYVEQLVPVVPGQSYVLTVDVRASVPNATLAIPICEKWMLTSSACVSLALETGEDVGAWHNLEVRFTAKELSVSPWYVHRPIKLSLYYPGPKSTIDIDNVRLESDGNDNLIRNGDFSKGLDHWFFATDAHLQWHTKSLFYGVLFDQGWFGVLTLSIFIGLALVRACKSAYRGDTIASAGLAGLSSFLVVGIFDTLIDAPRFLLLFSLLVWLCCYSVKRADAQAKPYQVNP